MAWFTETNIDHTDKELLPAILVADADEGVIDQAVDNLIVQLNKYNARWADGRTHLAGATLTSLDFVLLSLYTSRFVNTGLLNPSYGVRIKAHLDTLEHVTRVIENVKAICADQVAALGPSWI